MDDIGIGLIGTGYMGKCHALAWNHVRPVFGDVPRIRLAHLCDVEAGQARQRADAFGFAKATADWRALVSDPAVDVVSITTPNSFHAEMAIAALEAGKHIWCEKPMAPTLAESEAMAGAAQDSGKVAMLGYNYIQNPAIGHIRALLAAGAIGAVNHFRIEMDEDFMADAAAPFSWRSEKSAGYGALDDFGVHPLSLVLTLLGRVASVFGDMAKPFATRSDAGKQRPVETFDIASAFLRLASGITGALHMNRAAWGRKGRIFVQIFGAEGTILFDQERMNEVQVFTRDGAESGQGFRTILTGPLHKPYDRFIVGPGHQMGFNDLKTVECRQLIGFMRGEKAFGINFADGLHIERCVHAIAKAAQDGHWVDV